MEEHRTDAEFIKYYVDRRIMAIPVAAVRQQMERSAAVAKDPAVGTINQSLVEDIQFEIKDFNEDSSAGDPRYEIHCENLAGLLERVLKAVGAEVPAVPEW